MHLTYTGFNKKHRDTEEKIYICFFCVDNIVVVVVVVDKKLQFVGIDETA